MKKICQRENRGRKIKESQNTNHQNNAPFSHKILKNLVKHGCLSRRQTHLYVKMRDYKGDQDFFLNSACQTLVHPNDLEGLLKQFAGPLP